MRCPNCQIINPPYAKFCMECGYRLLICANCQTLNPPGAKFCIECGSSLVGTAWLNPSTGRASSTESVQFVPDVRLLPASNLADTRQVSAQFNGYASLSQLTEPEERRIVTVVFADITGSTPLADRLDPEDMRSILASYFNLMTEQIRRHGGTVEKYIGDAVMAVFGAPLAHEDDPDRAIRAALDMQSALNTFNVRRQLGNVEVSSLQMRIGINTGEVAAPSSHFSRRDFLITGDAVNVAARLQQIAVPDTILVGERTYLATRDVFDFHSLAPLNVKGKMNPLRAWAVVGFRSLDLSIAHRSRGIAGLQTPLVGRSLELTLMHATYARVRDARHSHMITLLGTPGVGKSRLGREFIERELEAARCTNCEEVPVEPRVLQGHCPSYGEGLTYWPFVEILRSLIQVQDGENGTELEERFIDFVHQTLRPTRRSEDIDKIASVLLQSMGQGLFGDKSSQGDVREMQRSTYNKDTDKGGPQAVLQYAFCVLLEALAQLRPLILIIDDLQWADEALLDLLEYLNGHITALPVLFICIARQDFLESQHDWGGGQSNFTTIILDALTREETGELIVEALATDELPDVLIHTIQQRAEGNPFFVEEIIQMLIDQGILIKENGMWRSSVQSEAILSELSSPSIPPEDTLMDQHYVLPLLRMPDTIQGVLAARVDLLGPVEKLVLQSASIVGRTFWVSSVLELVEDLDREQVLLMLERFVQRDFIGKSERPHPGPIEKEQSFSFKHILIRDVVYNNIPRARRSHKHAQLAAWLEEQIGERRETFSELLAYHYQQALANWSNVRTISFSSSGTEQEARGAGQLVHLTRSELVDRAIRYLTLAGDQAYHSYYTIRAIQAYTEALELMQGHTIGGLVVADMHKKLGHAYIQRASADEAWKEYLSALHLLKEQPDAPQKDLLYLYMNLAELATRWSSWFNNSPQKDEVHVYIDEGLKLLAGQPPSGEQSSFFTYLAMWYMRQVKQAPQEERAQLAEHALSSGRESLHIAEEVNDIDALWLALDALGFIYEAQNKYDEGHATQHRRQTLLDLIEGREELYDLYSSLGWTHRFISDYSTAASWFGRAWRIAQTMESPSMLLSNLRGRLEAWYEWDRWDEAREVSHRILQTCEQYQQDPVWQLSSLEMLAKLAYRMGDLEESEKYMSQYRRIFELTCHEPMLLPGMHMAYHDWTQALTDLRAKIEQAEPFPSPIDLAHMAELTILTNMPAEEQRSICEQAVDLASQSGARKALAIAQRACGRRELVQDSWHEAGQHFRSALERFQALDLPWERAETLYCLGQLYMRCSEHQNSATADNLSLARLCLEQSLGFFESLHAVHDVQKVRGMLSSAHQG